MSLEEKLNTFKEKGWKYNPETGDIFSHTGRVIKAVSKNGYLNCGTSNINVGGHQLAWFLYHNEVPVEVDHINMNKLDNRICNLRNVNRQKNQFNNKKAKGYSWDKNRNKWIAKIGLNGECINLGRFNTEQEARQAYLDAKKIYHII
jgi:hypothetical protein